MSVPDEEEPEAPLMEVSTVDYNTDSDYDDGVTAVTREEKPSKPMAAPAYIKPSAATAKLLQPELESLPPPRSSTQFEHTWSRVIRGNQQAEAEYLRSVGAAGLEALFKQGQASTEGGRELRLLAGSRDGIGAFYWDSGSSCS